MSRGRKAARMVVGSGLSTAGSGGRGGAGQVPLQALPSFALGPPLAVPERRPGPTRSLTSTSVGHVSPPAVNRVFLK